MARDAGMARVHRGVGGTEISRTSSTIGGQKYRRDFRETGLQPPSFPGTRRDDQLTDRIS